MGSLNSRFPVYSRLLRLYPPTHYKRYGEQMLLMLADMLDGSQSRRQRLFIWLQVSLDLPFSVVAQQLAYAGDVLAHETPPFVRRNTLVSSLLFLPFFAITTTNDVAAHTFYHTWLWRHGVLLTWIIILPTFGLLLSVATLCAWMAKAGNSRYRQLANVYQSWVLLAPLVVGAGILLLVYTIR